MGDLKTRQKKCTESPVPTWNNRNQKSSQLDDFWNNQGCVSESIPTQLDEF
jgi:hypothetical protein